MCTVVPTVFALASLLCMVLVLLGQLSYKGTRPPQELERLYFMKIQFPLRGALMASRTDIAESLNATVGLNKPFNEFYKVGLQSYCKGEAIDGTEIITYCSEPKMNFWFDPAAVLDLPHNASQHLLGSALQKGLGTYRKISYWTNLTFVFATFFAGAAFLGILLACSSCIGSVLAPPLSLVSSLFLPAQCSADCD